MQPIPGQSPDHSLLPPPSFWSDPATFWANPNAVRCVALLAVTLLVITVVLYRRRQSSGRGAAIVCLLLSVGLHAALIFWVPRLSLFWSGGGKVSQSEPEAGSESFSVAVFDSEMSDDSFASNETHEETSDLAPLPLAKPMTELTSPVESPPEEVAESAQDVEDELPPVDQVLPSVMPSSLASVKSPVSDEHLTDLDDTLGDWINETLTPEPKEQASQEVNSREPQPSQPTAQPASIENMAVSPTHQDRRSDDSSPSAKQPAKTRITGVVDQDFASRQGAAKTEALQQTGGDANTEQAVAQALRYLVKNQRADGAWDPLRTGAGKERAPLGLQRGGAGKRAETALTGLALLSLLGAGNTHQAGDYQDNVYRGLVYLLEHQRSDGSLAGGASVYAANYSHAMASLSIAETAAMTGDPSAIAATRKAVAFTKATQHPVTGGWRYTRGDTGDLSQLGWQAMVLDGASRAGATEQKSSTSRGIARFLDSVRSGRSGGLASYRPGERSTPTMTAEALATRLLIGQQVPRATIAEAESVLLANLPGQSRGPSSDNYYYWYYATIALHQLQDEAWQTWNTAMKQRLLSTQRSDGSWSDGTLWGGYGGTVYTTSMATLCLESYYRHSLRTGH